MTCQLEYRDQEQRRVGQLGQGVVDCQHRADTFRTVRELNKYYILTIYQPIYVIELSTHTKLRLADICFL